MADIELIIIDVRTGIGLLRGVRLAIHMIFLALLLVSAPYAGKAQKATKSGGVMAFDSRTWGSLAFMIEPEWRTEGLAVTRLSISNWAIIGQVLIIRHGSVERMKMGSQFADTVQRIEFLPASKTFEILYTYEDGRNLKAIGRVEPDGTFSETLVTPDGLPQRNLYLLDGPRRMRIVRQRRSGSAWVTTSIAVKLGETSSERLAREDREWRQREYFAAAQKARRKAAEEADLAALEAERAEEQAQRQRTANHLANILLGKSQRQDESNRQPQQMLGRSPSTEPTNFPKGGRTKTQAEIDAEAADFARQVNRDNPTYGSNNGTATIVVGGDSAPRGTTSSAAPSSASNDMRDWEAEAARNRAWQEETNRKLQERIDLCASNKSACNQGAKGRQE